MSKISIKNRLEELRKEIQAERISYGEIMELQSLAKHIDKNDVELLQWAGVEENETKKHYHAYDEDSFGHTLNDINVFCVESKIPRPFWSCYEDNEDYEGIAETKFTEIN